MKKVLRQFTGLTRVSLLFCLILMLSGVGLAFGLESNLARTEYTESIGAKPDRYLVRDINALDKPYNYLIGKTTYSVIEIFGIVAFFGALMFSLLHGLGRIIARMKKPKPPKEPPHQTAGIAHHLRSFSLDLR